VQHGGSMPINPAFKKIADEMVAEDDPLPDEGRPLGPDPPPHSDDFPSEEAKPKPSIEGAVLPLADWLGRDLPPPVPLLGDWLTTTSRALFTAPTGTGKSLFWVAAGMRVAGGLPFLRWAARRPCKVLYIDGEMSNRLLRDRLMDEARRLGARPAGFYALSHEDVSNFAPINTPEGQNLIEAVIAKIGKVELIIFDNIMSLVAGDMKDEEGWRQTLPFQHSLTRRKIGQAWLHHTGHNEKQPYGTSTREWQVDTSLFGTRDDRPETDVSLKLEFRKARERRPENRADFADISIAMISDEWTYSSPEGGNKAEPSPTGRKFLDALHDALASDDAATTGGIRRISLEAWRKECFALSLIDRDREDSARALFSKHKRELIVCNQIACNESQAWVL
jgi:AAA domain